MPQPSTIRACLRSNIDRCLFMAGRADLAEDPIAAAWWRGLAVSYEHRLDEAMRVN